MDGSYSGMTIHATYAVFLLSVVIRTREAALVDHPTDINVTVGERVTLLCSTNLDLPVYWFFNGIEIFYGGKVDMSYQAMFNVNPDKEKGEYNLVIPSAEASHSGKYECGDDEGQGERALVWVYVTGLIAVTEVQSAPNSDSANPTSTVIILVVVICLGVLAIITGIAFIVYRKWKQRRHAKRNTTSENPEDVNLIPEAERIPPTADVRPELSLPYPSTTGSDQFHHENVNDECGKPPEGIVRQRIQKIEGPNVPTSSTLVTNHAGENIESPMTSVLSADVSATSAETEENPTVTKLPAILENAREHSDLGFSESPSAANLGLSFDTSGSTQNPNAVTPLKDVNFSGGGRRVDFTADPSSAASSALRSTSGAGQNINATTPSKDVNFSSGERRVDFTAASSALRTPTSGAGQNVHVNVTTPSSVGGEHGVDSTSGPSAANPDLSSLTSGTEQNVNSASPSTQTNSLTRERGQGSIAAAFDENSGVSFIEADSHSGGTGQTHENVSPSIDSEHGEHENGGRENVTKPNSTWQDRPNQSISSRAAGPKPVLRRKPSKNETTEIKVIEKH